MADDLAVGVFVAELDQLFAAEAEQHLFGALAAAVALVMDIALVKDLRVKPGHRQLHDILGRFALPEQGGDGRHGRNVLLQTGDLRVGRAGQKLQQVAAGTEDGQVFVHQNAQRTDGRDLLAVGIVAGQILRDLAGDQRNLTDGWLLLQLIIPDDGQHAVLADRSADIQMPVCTGRQLHQRVVDAALDIAGAVGAGDDHTGRAVARHPQGDGIPVVLEHRTHQGCTGQQATQSRTAGGTGGVQFFGCADDLRRVDPAEHDAAVVGQAADQM